MTKKNKIILIISIALILTVLAVVTVMAVFSNKVKVKNSDTIYETVENEQLIMIHSCYGLSGDFVYFNDIFAHFPEDYYAEYDVDKGSLIELPVKNYIDNFNFYNGELYTVLYNNNNKLTISKVDINTGNYEEIYVTPPGIDGLYNFTMSKSGLMFFNERRPTSEIEYGKYVENEDGFRINYMLYMYNPETKKKHPLWKVRNCTISAAKGCISSVFINPCRR